MSWPTVTYVIFFPLQRDYAYEVTMLSENVICETTGLYYVKLPLNLEWPVIQWT
jgi:hypothetical protein